MAQNKTNIKSKIALEISFQIKFRNLRSIPTFA